MDVNLTAVLVATIAAYAVGALWYSVLFKEPWMRLMGISAEHMNSPEGKKAATRSMAGGFVVTLVLVYVLAHLIILTGVLTVAGGLTLGFWLWLGFVATIMFNSVLYERRPLMLYLINASHYLAAILLAALVLAWWPW